MSVLIVYLVILLVGQAAMVGVGLLIDSYSQTLALTVFIVSYYAMFWFAWRAALFIFERPGAAQPAPSDTTDDKGGSAAKVATWLFAPALVALDFCD